MYIGAPFNLREACIFKTVIMINKWQNDQEFIRANRPRDITRGNVWKADVTAENVKVTRLACRVAVTRGYDVYV